MKTFLLFLGSLFLCCFQTVAQTSSTTEYVNIIDSINVSVNDCPTSSMMAEIDQLLTAAELSPQERNHLLVQKSNGLSCIGQHQQSLVILKSVLSASRTEVPEESYASALFLYGHQLQINENISGYDILDEGSPTFCRYYSEAIVLSEDKYVEVYVRTTLESIIHCESDVSNTEENLATLYLMLEKYPASQNTKLAYHIRASMGLFFSRLGQNDLAAEQHEFAHSLVQDLPDTESKMTPLYNVISSHLWARNLDVVESKLREYEKANLAINTPLTNADMFHLKSAYFNSIGDYEALKLSLLKWQVFLPDVSDSAMHDAYKLYEMSLCYNENNLPCLERLLKELTTKRSVDSSLSISYVRAIIRALIALDRPTELRAAFERYIYLNNKSIASQQKSARVLGVAQTHAKVLKLREVIQQEERSHRITLLSIVLGSLSLIGIVIWAARRQFILQFAHDPLTGTLKETIFISRLKALRTPTKNTVHIVGAFNINEFNKLSSEFGHKSGDLVLVHVANLLRSYTKKQDVLCRMSTSSFGVCLPDVDESNARQFIEKIKSAIEHSVCSSEFGDEIELEVSTAIYLSEEKISDPEGALKHLRRSFD